MSFFSTIKSMLPRITTKTEVFSPPYNFPTETPSSTARLGKVTFEQTATAGPLSMQRKIFIYLENKEEGEVTTISTEVPLTETIKEGTPEIKEWHKTIQCINSKARLSEKAVEQCIRRYIETSMNFNRGEQSSNIVIGVLRDKAPALFSSHPWLTYDSVTTYSKSTYVKQ